MASVDVLESIEKLRDGLEGRTVLLRVPKGVVKVFDFVFERGAYFVLKLVQDGLERVNAFWPRQFGR